MSYTPGSEYSAYGGYADDLALLCIFLVIMGRILIYQGKRALTALYRLSTLLLRDLQRWYSAR
jgi:hypothetical protein